MPGIGSALPFVLFIYIPIKIKTTNTVPQYEGSGRRYLNS
jgi:hypothetical protein